MTDVYDANGRKIGYYFIRGIAVWLILENGDRQIFRSVKEMYEWLRRN